MVDQKKSVVVVIDIQGRLADVVAESETLFKEVTQLLNISTTLEIPTLATEQIPEKLGATRSELSKLLTDATIIPKTSFSCCGERSFMDALKALNRKQVVLCGIESHICLLQTAIELLEKDFEVFVVEAAVSSRDPQNKKLAIQRMRQAGAKIVSNEMLMFEWLRDATNPAFKSVRSFLN